ncbi:hypothetical protein DFH07DRAFT_777177 [Mycena maculata]|uniref:Uncharacterized protein n=1 Tax=Mycena maculata TaxID=230809 RepID=A0AAD7N3H5_9AGAR|nr:hypothetical protein DFH07DRAFT_777177 [Mycena maculata]
MPPPERGHPSGGTQRISQPAPHVDPYPHSYTLLTACLVWYISMASCAGLRYRQIVCSISAPHLALFKSLPVLPWRLWHYLSKWSMDAMAMVVLIDMTGTLTVYAAISAPPTFLYRRAPTMIFLMLCTPPAGLRTSRPTFRRIAEISHHIMLELVSDTLGDELTAVPVDPEDAGIAQTLQAASDYPWAMPPLPPPPPTSAETNKWWRIAARRCRMFQTSRLSTMGVDFRDSDRIWTLVFRLAITIFHSLESALQIRDVFGLNPILFAKLTPTLQLDHDLPDMGLRLQINSVGRINETRGEDVLLHGADLRPAKLEGLEDAWCDDIDRGCIGLWGQKGRREWLLVAGSDTYTHHTAHATNDTDAAANLNGGNRARKGSISGHLLGSSHPHQRDTAKNLKERKNPGLDDATDAQCTGELQYSIRSRLIVDGRAVIGDVIMCDTGRRFGGADPPAVDPRPETPGRGVPFQTAREHMSEKRICLVRLEDRA